MMKRIVLSAVLAAFICVADSAPAAAQEQLLYFSGPCSQFIAVSPGETTSTFCSATAAWLIGQSFPWRRFSASFVWGKTDPFSCPVPNLAFHLAEVLHYGGPERLEIKAYVSGSGPIIRRDGRITASGVLTQGFLPFAPWNCWTM